MVVGASVSSVAVADSRAVSHGLVVLSSGVAVTSTSVVVGAVVASDAATSSSLSSSLIRSSIKPAAEAPSSCSTFLLFHNFPFGAGSSGVLQYVTVRVTTCLTLTLPGWPPVSALISRDSNDALQGAELSGVEMYGDAIVCAEPIAGENGDCGM